MILLLALLLRLLLFLYPRESDDLHRYLLEGRMQLKGLNPYRVAPDDPALGPLADPRVSHPSMTTIYPPLAQYAFRLAASLGLAERGFRNAVLLLDAAAVALLLRWRGRAAALYAFHPLALLSAAEGHIDPLMLLFLAGMGLAHARGMWKSAAICLGLAILSKTVAALLLPWLLWRRPRAALLALLVAAAGYLPFLGPGLFDTLAAFSRLAYNGSLHRLFGSRLLCGALLLLWTAFVALWHRRFETAAPLLFAGLLLCSPTVHFWYLTWFLFALPLRRWALPLLLWSLTALLTLPDYLRPEFSERAWVAPAEYLPVLLLALFLLFRRWPRPAPAAPAIPAAPVAGATVVIPCRGEAASLRELLPALGAIPCIVADTPTGDGTRALAGERWLEVRETGYGNAVRAGLARVATEFAVVLDADHHLGPSQIGALLAPFADPSVGLVTAARTTPLPAAQRFGNAFASLLVAFGWGRRFRDFGPFRALRLSAWRGRLPRDGGFGWNVEMNVRALEAGIGVVEVALPAGARRHGVDRISRTVAGVVGAGWGILSRIVLLRR